uniref:ANK_REP_REGION domain-containing protein n=1 Tax=Dracunculus medinensis TaxID=318479 RepID=A0A0N4UKA2_DRAME
LVNNYKKSNEPFVSAWESSGENKEAAKQVPKTVLSVAERGDLEALKEMISRDKNADNYTALHRAAYNNHVDCLSYLLSIGADHEARTVDGWTPLHCASRWASAACVGELISHGAYVNSRTNNNLTPLHLILNSDEPLDKIHETFRYLLESPGSFFLFLSNADETPLELARKGPKLIASTIEKFISRP